MVGDGDRDRLSVGIFNGIVDEIVKSHTQQMRVSGNREVTLTVQLAASLSEALQQGSNVYRFEFRHLF